MPLITFNEKTSTYTGGCRTPMPSTPKPSSPPPGK